MKKLFAFAAAAIFALSMNAEAITVAAAIEAGMALDSAATSTQDYTVEGYVINAAAFSQLYRNQSWYMADAADATASDFQAFNCYPIEDGDTLKVLNGDKVSITGKLKKYYNKSTSKYIIEIEKGIATFISKVDGDHTVSTEIESVTVAQALTIGAALANNASTEKQYTITGYVSAINVKSSDAWSDQHKNQSFWVADDPNSTAKTNADGAFYVYRGKPETGAALAVGTKVQFTNTIKRYVPSSGDPVIENTDQNITIKVLEAPQIDTLTAAAALSAAQALPVDGTKNVAVLAYVASIKTAYNSQYGNITVYLTDDPTSTYGDIQAYRAKCSATDGPNIAAHDKVLVVGTLVHTQYEKDGETKDSYQIAEGSQLTVVEKAQGIENVVLTEKAQKVMVDGVMYIVRDGKMYNVQGAQVR